MGEITKAHIYRLLGDALLELRMEGYIADNRLVFLLADLFHNIPAHLDRVDRGELTPEDVLAELRSHAQRTRMESWLNRRVSEVMSRVQDRDSD